VLDEEKLIALYRRHSRELFVFIVRYTGSHEAAEDILHDCFENLMSYAARYPITDDNLRAFLFTTARNLCVNRHRSRVRRGPRPLDESAPDRRTAAPDALSESRELAALIATLVEGLDEPDRSIFLMKKELGLTYPEIARATGHSERTVRRRLSETLDRMRDALHAAGFLAFFVFLPFFVAAYCATIVTHAWR